jgi:hypothetical protein
LFAMLVSEVREIKREKRVWFNFNSGIIRIGFISIRVGLILNEYAILYPNYK